MRDKGEMGQCRSGGDDLGAGDANAGIALTGGMRVDVGRATRHAGRHVAVDWRMDDRVVDEWYPLLAVAVPVAGIFLVRVIELGIGAQCREEGGLVIGRA